MEIESSSVTVVPPAVPLTIAVLATRVGSQAAPPASVRREQPVAPGVSRVEGLRSAVTVLGLEHRAVVAARVRHLDGVRGEGHAAGFVTHSVYSRVSPATAIAGPVLRMAITGGGGVALRMLRNVHVARSPATRASPV